MNASTTAPLRPLGCALLACALLLTACGGGSTTPPPVVTPPVTPPTPVEPPLPPTPPGLYLVAGHTGSLALADGSGTNARFNYIDTLLFDHGGAMYVSESILRPGDTFDTAATHVRAVSAAGQVSTILSVPSAGNHGLSPRQAIALDTSGKLLYRAGFTYQHLAADGSLSAGVKPPERLRFGPGGQGYAIDYTAAGFTSIAKVDRNGQLTPFVGTDEKGAADGTGLAARFGNLRDITFDQAGNLYVIDGYAVRKVSVTGAVNTLAGAPLDTSSAQVDGKGSAARFYDSHSIAFAADRLLVLDRCPNAVCSSATLILRSVSLDGAVTTIGPMPHALDLHSDLAGNVYLRRAGDILKLGTDGQFTPFAGQTDESRADVDGAGGAARLRMPMLMAADPAGNLVVSEAVPYGSHVGPYERAGIILRKITPAGAVSTLVNSDLTAPAPAWKAPAIGKVSGMAFDKAGNLYLSEVAVLGDPRFTSVLGGAIYRITADGASSLFAGLHGSWHDNEVQRDGIGGEARFSSPALLGFDHQGNLYVADAGGTRRRITPDAVVTTVSSVPPEVGAVYDQGGSALIADTAASTISRISKEGVSAVIAGKAGQSATIPGALPASIDQPRSLVRLGPNIFAFISGNAVVKLVLP